MSKLAIDRIAQACFSLDNHTSMHNEKALSIRARHYLFTPTGDDDYQYVSAKYTAPGAYSNSSSLGVQNVGHEVRAFRVVHVDEGFRVAVVKSWAWLQKLGETNAIRLFTCKDPVSGFLGCHPFSTTQASLKHHSR